MKIKKISFWQIITAIIFALCIYATFIRFGVGLGASTNLSDKFPWGLWVGFDVLVGVGLAAGGFVIAATVHIFNLEKYESIGRPAILTAFLGYLLVVFALMFDLGRPYRIWHPLVMWNPHSVMFEVGWCVTLYTIVLALEFSPIVFERFKLHVPLRIIRTIYLPVVIAGVILSTLHQSSLGTFYVIVPDKLYGLWYSPFLPVFFFISAIAAGMAMTIIESFLSYRAFGKKLEKDLLTGVGRVIVVFLAIYFVFKFQDLYQRGNLPLVFKLNRESVLFWGEIGLGVLLPMILLFIKKIRENGSTLFFSALLVVLGFIVNRLNVSITGMRYSETYIPKWTEIIVTVSIVVLGFVIFALAVKHLNVFPKEELLKKHEKVDFKKEKHPVFAGNTVIALWGLLVIGIIAFSLSESNQGGNPANAAEGNSITRTTDPHDAALNLPADIVYPKGEDSPGVVTFSHESHVGMQEKPDCSACHAEMFDILKNGQPDIKSVTMEKMYEGQSCGKCHDGEVAFNVEECGTCHVE